MALWEDHPTIRQISLEQLHVMANVASPPPQTYNYEDIYGKEQPATDNNVTDFPSSSFNGSVETVFIAVTLGIFILLTLIGNFLVIIAIFTEKNLKGLANYLIFSLAVADLMVAVLVLPISAYNEVQKQEWVLGPELCQMWTSLDVLCCTSSILHLLAIAVDRYWAVTDVEYARCRQPKKIYLLIAGVWAGAFVISFAPVFGWKDPNFHQRLENDKRCLVSQNVLYQVFATCSSFYIPLIGILILYWNIFKQARTRIRRRPGAPAVLIERSQNGSAHSADHHDVVHLPLTENGVDSNQTNLGRLLVLAKREKKIAKESIEAKRERKAAKTLMIITGAFIVCWLPFFVMALLMAVCQTCEPSDTVFGVLLWLGYTNSLINPIIYTIFSPDFRNAFKRMLCRVENTTQRH